METAIRQLRAAEAIKFIINGRTFDTATSTTLAVDCGITDPDYNNVVGDCEVRFTNVLYRTAKGALFIHFRRSEKRVKGGGPVVFVDYVEEKTGEEAVEWIAERQAIVLDAADLPLPPEA